MDMAFFNADHGFAEALVRGFRSTFVSRDEITSMRECPTLAAMNAVLQETDFGEIMPRSFPAEGGGGGGGGAAAAGGARGPAASSGPAFDHTKLRRKLQEKAAEEFRMLRAHSVEPLSTFLDFITHEYMIDMVVSIMHVVQRVEATGVTEHIVEEVRGAADAAHPLGRLDPTTETAIAGFSASASDLVDLVRSLLVETPVGVYFEEFLLKVLSPEDFGRADGVAVALSEQPLYLLEHATKRIWMERFHGWCASQGGETAERMCAFLDERAALLAVSLADNALTDGAVKPEQRPEVLQACFPAIGPLHPTGLARLMAVKSQADIERVVMEVPSLSALWMACPLVRGSVAGGERRITVPFRKHLAASTALLYNSQFHFGAFYAFAKLKDAETDAIQQVANAVAAFETRAASVGAAERKRIQPTAEVKRSVEGLVIPFETISPAEGTSEAAALLPGSAAGGGYTGMP